MGFKKILKEMHLKPISNKKNGQINFHLKKNSLPQSIKNNLSNLKSINLKEENFEFY